MKRTKKSSTKESYLCRNSMITDFFTVISNTPKKKTSDDIQQIQDLDSGGGDGFGDTGDNTKSPYFTNNKNNNISIDLPVRRSIKKSRLDEEGHSSNIKLSIDNSIDLDSDSNSNNNNNTSNMNTNNSNHNNPQNNHLHTDTSQKMNNNNQNNINGSNNGGDAQSIDNITTTKDADKPVTKKITMKKPVTYSMFNNSKIGGTNNGNNNNSNIGSNNNNVGGFVSSRSLLDNKPAQNLSSFNSSTPMTTTTTTTTSSTMNGTNQKVNIKPISKSDEFDLPSNLETFQKKQQQQQSIMGQLNTFSGNSLSNRQANTNGNIFNNTGFKKFSTLGSSITKNGNIFQSSNFTSTNNQNNNTTSNNNSLKLTKAQINAQISAELSEEQKKVVTLALDGKNMFYTGSAGTGKSFVLKEIVRCLKLFHGEKVNVTASTGIAACNIGGSTVHSFAGIGFGDKTSKEYIQSIQGNNRTLSKWRSCKVLIIDEVSMISAELLDKLEQIARGVRRSDRPFGGIQLILVGDFCQLPPVIKKQNQTPQQQNIPDDPLLQLLAKDNKSPYCFKSECWGNTIEHSILLKQVFRQKDLTFVNILNEIRFGIINQSSMDILNQCVTNIISSDDGIVPTILYPHRKSVESENLTKLNALKGDSYTFDAVDDGQDFYKEQLKNLQAPPTLTLKEGSQVILLMNIDFEMGLVNGSRGVVVGWSDTEVVAPIVKFTNGIERVIGIEVWKIEIGTITVASRRQLPLNLAWALSIHKSQGMSIDKLIIDLDGTFESGQAYVALSRSTSLGGLQLKSPIKKQHFFTDRAIIDFYNYLDSKYDHQFDCLDNK